MPRVSRLTLPGFLFRKTSLVPCNFIRYNERRHEQWADRESHNLAACRQDCVVLETGRAKPGHLGNACRSRDALRGVPEASRSERLSFPRCTAWVWEPMHCVVRRSQAGANACRSRDALRGVPEPSHTAWQRRRMRRGEKKQHDR